MKKFLVFLGLLTSCAFGLTDMQRYYTRHYYRIDNQMSLPVVLFEYVANLDDIRVEPNQVKSYNYYENGRPCLVKKFRRIAVEQSDGSLVDCRLTNFWYRYPVEVAVPGHYEFLVKSDALKHHAGSYSGVVQTRCQVTITKLSS